jgi:hypothetical protein
LRSVSVDRLLGGRAGARAALRGLDRVAEALTRTGRMLWLEDCGALCTRLVGPGAGRSGPLGDWLRSLGAVAHGASRRVDLAPPGAVSPEVLVRLLDELHTAVQAEDAIPRLALTWGELEPVLVHAPRMTRVAEELARRGVLLPVRHGRGERWIGPGLRRRLPRTSGERPDRRPVALWGVVALPLPRLARRAGPWCEEKLMSALIDTLALAAEAVTRLDAFQSEQRGARGDSSAERRVFALVPVGLTEALRILGDGRSRSSQGARVLGLIAEAAARIGTAHGLELGLSSEFGELAARRFARADAAQRRASQARLFVDMPTPEDGLELAYSTGFRLPPEGSPGVEGERAARLHAGLGAAEILPAGPPAGPPANTRSPMGPPGLAGSPALGGARLARSSSASDGSPLLTFWSAFAAGSPSAAADPLAVRGRDDRTEARTPHPAFPASAGPLFSGPHHLGPQVGGPPAAHP